MSGSEQSVPIKRSRSEEAQDDALLGPPSKIGPAQLKLNGKAWTKHPRYYFEDGSITLLVQETAYRVQGSLLVLYSPYWRDLLGSALDKDCGPKELKDVTRQELDAVFSILYPRSFESYDIATADEWAYVLSVSVLWKIPSLRALALSKLDTTASPWHKLVLARAFNVPHWVEPSFDALARRTEPLTLQEANMLGMEDVLRVSAARENLSKLKAAPPAPGSATRAATQVNARTPTRRTSQTSSGPSRTATAPVKPPLPVITVPFTSKELKELSSLLSEDRKFDKIFPIVTMEKVPAFCHAAADFSDLLAPGYMHHMSLSSALFTHIATRPAYIPVAAKLASIIAHHNDHTEPRNGRLVGRFPGLKACLQGHVDRLRALWASVNHAKAKYPDFALAFKSGSRKHSFTGCLLGFELYDDPPREAIYNERSANAQRFIMVLAGNDTGRLVQ